VYAQVALPLSSYRTFTYRVPAELVDRLLPGSFVTVPFRNRDAIGVVTALDRNTTFAGPIKTISGLKAGLGTLPPDLWDTLEWMSRYYFTPLGMVLKTALPLEFSRKSRPQQHNVVSITADGRSALAAGSVRGPAQKAVLALLAGQASHVPVQSLTALTASAATLCRNLARRGWVHLEQQAKPANPLRKFAPPPAKQVRLTDEQQDTVAALGQALEAHAFAPFLLHGVTGSGKTEVYLQAAQQVIAGGGSVLVLVPEIALTPQVADRFRATFGDRVALWHSHISQGEKAWTWQELLAGRLAVVVGARSALFAPLPKLRLIIVDEEQEGTYKQEDPAPRYHARDVALVRGKHAGAVVVLTSATPSVESYYNGLLGRYRTLSLTRRFGGAVYPKVRLVDLNVERQRTDNYQLVLSDVLVEAIEERLKRREQVILLQNLRGYAPVSGCNDCGYTSSCPHCAVLLSYHKGIQLLKCHYCGYTTPGPEACPACDSPHIYMYGVGTEQVEELLRQLFPTARIGRMDADTTRRQGAHHAILQDFGDGKLDILLGTQMIAKGLDFPNVTLVGVVNGDMGLYLPDFRAGERTFQLVYQVSGRAGRHQEKPGEAIVQTNHPDDLSIQAAARLDAHRFYNQILAERRELIYPPFSRLIRFLLQGKDRDRVWELARELHDRLKPLGQGMRLLGPASAPFERLRGLWRVHLLIKSNREFDPNGQQLHALVHKRVPRPWIERSQQGVRLKIDVDPVNML